MRQRISELQAMLAEYERMTPAERATGEHLAAMWRSACELPSDITEYRDRDMRAK